MTTTTARTVARADLCRTASFQMRADESRDDAQDGLTIDGYASVYGADLADGEEPSQRAGWSLIDSWEGTFWERFVFGAYKKSLRERTPIMQFDHGRHPLLGSLPLGRWQDVSEEDGAGLHTVGRLSDNWLVEPFRDAIRDRAVDGMSIRFEVVRDEWRSADGRVIRDTSELLSLLERPDETGPLRRTVREAKLLEAGPVTWPAYQATSVGVRSAERTVTIDLGRLRDPQQRSLLARAVFLADAVTAADTPDDFTADGPRPTAEAAGEHPQPVRTTSTTSTVDTPRSTAPEGAAGEHESVPKPIRKDHIDLARERATVRPFQDALDEVAAVLASL